MTDDIEALRDARKAKWLSARQDGTFQQTHTYSGTLLVVG
jgi:hypothetical protein